MEYEMILTNGEIYTSYIEAANQTLRPQDERIALAFARAIEAAVLTKLSQGVSVEPDVHPDAWAGGFYSRHRLTTAIAAARVQALEDAAVVCAAQNPTGSVNQEWMQERCADAIRALKGGAA